MYPRPTGTSGAASTKAATGIPRFRASPPPLPRGHTPTLKLGGYSVLHLKPRAEEIAALLREQVVEGERFAVAIESAAMVAARLEAAFDALSQASPGELRRLDQDARLGAAVAARALTTRTHTSAHARILRDAGLGKAAVARAALGD